MKPAADIFKYNPFTESIVIGSDVWPGTSPPELIPQPAKLHLTTYWHPNHTVSFISISYRQSPLVTVLLQINFTLSCKQQLGYVFQLCSGVRDFEILPLQQIYWQPRLYAPYYVIRHCCSWPFDGLVMWVPFRCVWSYIPNLVLQQKQQQLLLLLKAASASRLLRYALKCSTPHYDVLHILLHVLLRQSVQDANMWEISNDVEMIGYYPHKYTLSNSFSMFSISCSFCPRFKKYCQTRALFCRLWLWPRFPIQTNFVYTVDKQLHTLLNH